MYYLLNSSHYLLNNGYYLWKARLETADYSYSGEIDFFAFSVSTILGESMFVISGVYNVY